MFNLKSFVSLVTIYVVCSPASAIASNECVDSDGDGWGWTGSSSCRIKTCVDSDGDGWGWDGHASCLMTAVDSHTGSTPEVDPPSNSQKKPVSVSFDQSTLRRVGGKGDNWCQTWASDGSVITAMDDGDWINNAYRYHTRLYRITGSAENFQYSEINNFPEFHVDYDGWFGYGLLSSKGVLYSLMTKTQTAAWSDGPFRGIKLLRSYDNGQTWNRVNKSNQDRKLNRYDMSRELLSQDEMFFLEEDGIQGKGKVAYPFAFADFVQNGQDNRAAKDGYIYIYSPEGAKSNELLLARVQADEIGNRNAWEFFSGWQNGQQPTWSPNLCDRRPNIRFPEKNSKNEYFGFYSWLPSVVWNEGLGYYIMVNGGTYGGESLSNSEEDYYDRWMHTKTGSLGFWYSENPYGPWKQFYYTDYWTTDDPKNLNYQPKLSPKWISSDGKRMTLIWSDAMKNPDGYSHSTNYKWNQMEIEIEVR